MDEMFYILFFLRAAAVVCCSSFLVCCVRAQNVTRVKIIASSWVPWNARYKINRINEISVLFRHVCVVLFERRRRRRRQWWNSPSKLIAIMTIFIFRGQCFSVEIYCLRLCVCLCVRASVQSTTAASLFAVPNLTRTKRIIYDRGSSTIGKIT